MSSLVWRPPRAVKLLPHCIVGLDINVHRIVCWSDIVQWWVWLWPSSVWYAWKLLQLALRRTHLRAVNFQTQSIIGLDSIAGLDIDVNRLIGWSATVLWRVRQLWFCFGLQLQLVEHANLIYFHDAFRLTRLATVHRTIVAIGCAALMDFPVC
jgi:hypothetical protein